MQAVGAGSVQRRTGRAGGRKRAGRQPVLQLERQVILTPPHDTAAQRRGRVSNCSGVSFVAASPLERTASDQ